MTKNELNKHMAQMYGISDQAIDKMNGRIERQLIATYKRSLKSVKAQLAGMYEKYGDNVKYTDMLKFNRLTKLESRIEDEITELGRGLRKITRESIQDNMTEAYYHSGYIMETPVDVDMGFAGLDPKVVRASVINPQDRIKWPESMGNNLSVLNDSMKRSVTEGLVQGYGYSKTARNFRDKFETSVYRANRIVRTESARGKTVGRNLAFDQSVEAGKELGLNVAHIWDATNDSRTRPKHKAMDGKHAKLVNGEWVWTFPDGVTTKGPGLSGVAEHDIHERCDTYTEIDKVTKDFENEHMRDKEIQHTSYKDWAKANGIKTKINLPGRQTLRKVA